MTQPIIGFIGCGNMGSAVIDGLINSETFPKEQIIAELGLKPSRGYQEINAAKELTKKFLEL